MRRKDPRIGSLFYLSLRYDLELVGSILNIKIDQYIELFKDFHIIFILITFYILKYFTIIGSGRMLLCKWLGEASLCHGNFCHGCQHAC